MGVLGEEIILLLNTFVKRLKNMNQFSIWIVACSVQSSSVPLLGTILVSPISLYVAEIWMDFGS